MINKKCTGELALGLLKKEIMKSLQDVTNNLVLSCTLTDDKEKVCYIKGKVHAYEYCLELIEKYLENDSNERI